MDFQEAKDITLWKLALTYGEGGKVPEIYHSRTDPRRRERFWVEQMDMDDSSQSCAFCQVGLSIIASGIAKWITTNVTDAGNTLTEAEFNTFLESIFRYGAKKKMLIACSKVVSALDSWGRAAVRVLPKDTTYGISVKQYLTSHGTLNVTKHDLLEEYYNETAFALEPASMWYRPLQGVKNRDTHLKKNIQDNKNDSEQDEWLTEVGLHLEHEKKHGRLHNVDQYSA